MSVLNYKPKTDQQLDNSILESETDNKTNKQDEKLKEIDEKLKLLDDKLKEIKTAKNKKKIKGKGENNNLISKKPMVNTTNISGSADIREYKKNYLYLQSYGNGSYVIKSYWKEEEQITFDILSNLIFDKVNPIIKYINIMQFSLSPLLEINQYNSEYIQLGLNVIWKYQLTNEEFTKFKEYFDDDFK